MGHLKHVANAIFIVILCADFSTIRSGLGSCIFDKIKLEKPQSITVRYENDSHLGSESRHKRASSSSLYRPIRIAVEYSNLDEELTMSEQEGLKQLVDNMVRKVTNIFSVVPVQGNLLLRRASDGCLVVWQTGPNMGKCSRARRRYSKEICIDDFQIPNSHLSGVKLWNATDPEPIDVLIEDGEGLPHTDYVLYVQSRTAHLCISQGYNVIAYAAYCQVDQHGRPIAGYINFCPQLLRDDKKEIDEVTALHEMFHALGFSKDLFDKFQECTPTGSNGVTCTTRKRSVRTIGGVPRLVTPRLVEVTSRHFNCTTHAVINEFGPILQTKNGIYQSHWDPAFMQTSLMTPTIGLPHLTFIDEITLSLFEDSGWYRVNYNYAQQFLWGKGGGCDFGTAPACENKSALFCTGEARRCHYLHKDKATCKTNSFLHGCRIFQVKDIEDSCQHQPTGGRASGDEYYGEDGRCFVANLTEVAMAMQDSVSAEMTGRCYQHRCNNSQLLVQVGHSPWLNCPQGKLIQVAGYGGVLQCPDSNVVCGASVRVQSIKTKVHSTTTSGSRGTKTTQPRKTTTHATEFNADPATTEASENRTCLEITFSSSYNPVLYVANTGAFHAAMVDAIILLSGVRHRRLDDAQVINSSDVVYYIEMRQRYNASDGPTNAEVFKRLESAVHTGGMTVTLTEDDNTYVASSIGHTRGKCEVSSHRRYTGVIIGAALGSLASMAVIGVLVGLLIVSLRRRHIAQTAPASQTGGDT